MELVGVFSLSLLGAFAAALDGRPLTKFRTSKVQALLIYLAVENKQAYRRDFLMELLWPGLPQSSAQVNLRQTIHRLNEAIPAVAAKGADEINGARTVPLLLADRQTVQIHPDGRYALDVATFTNLLKGEPTPTQFAQAVSLYRGDFLTDFYLPDSETFESWAAARREAFRRLALDALERLADYHRQQMDYQAAEQSARRQLEIDNLRESAHRQLMEVLAESGRRRAALSHYETLCQLLQAELGITPSPATIDLYEQIKDDKVTRWQGDRVTDTHDVTLSPPHPVTLSPPHNLPSPATPFVGRKSELETLGQHLADPGTRLITILGPGGIGKTRLALAAAEAQLSNGRPTPGRPTPAFPHGVYFVGLARLDTADLLIPTIATALDFRFYEGGEPQEQLLNYLRRKEMLLVLDNFEHLLAGAGLIDEILSTAPGIKLLMTSREKLNLQAEQLFPIGGLALPEEDTAVDTEVTGYDAIQLFLQSARRTRPDFVLTADNQSDVLHICRLVEGMPLGIILAAAWLELLTPQEIVVEMGRDLDFLATEMGDVPERQRSLRAVFNHSWRLLSEREQAIFQQLSIFRGGCTREAAEVVTRATLRDLQSLVSKSLLHRSASGRYEIHELLRQFVATQIEDQDKIEAIRRSHAVYFLTLAEEAETQRKGAGQLLWLNRLEIERYNLVAVLQWAMEHENAEMAARLAGSLGKFWGIRGYLIDGRYWLEKVLAYRQQLSTQALAKALFAVGWLAFEGADYTKAKHYYADSLALWRELNQTEWIAESLNLLGHAAQQEGDYASAVAYYEQSRVLYRELGDKSGIALALNRLGYVAQLMGNYAQATTFIEESLTIRRDLDERRGIAASLNALAEMARLQGNHERAQLLYEESLSLCRELGDKRCVAGVSHNLGHVAQYQGNYEIALALFQRGLVLYQELRNAEGIALCLAGIAGVTAVQGRAEQAAKLFGAAEVFLETAYVLLSPADKLAWQHNLDNIHRQLDETTLQAAWAIGRTLTLDEAVRDALHADSRQQHVSGPAGSRK